MLLVNEDKPPTHSDTSRRHTHLVQPSAYAADSIRLIWNVHHHHLLPLGLRSIQVRTFVGLPSRLPHKNHS